MTESTAIIEAIQATQRAQGANALQAASAAAVQPTADPAAVEKFQAAMVASPVQSVPLTEQIAATWKSTQQAHQNMLHRITALNQYSREKSPTLLELAELQYDIGTLLYHQEMTSNVAKKASDAVQTLIKNG